MTHTECQLCTCPNCMALLETEAYVMEAARAARYEEYRWLYEPAPVITEEPKRPWWNLWMSTDPDDHKM